MELITTFFGIIIIIHLIINSSEMYTYDHFLLNTLMYSCIQGTQNQYAIYFMLSRTFLYNYVLAMLSLSFHIKIYMYVKLQI